ncbi:TetR/AcrR family transcriptional regulator [Pedobacter nyackensis]|uniref:TetR/AcrR family transcriptional regulator n=1 Tax=Pedobacter nyackensis TaxID=475255 RepID=UPI00292F86E0|nr:TetR/AcrR family transcriptional regulator [Pedobacter nyackensis]
MTRQMLIDAVGDILREDGWRGLGVNKIAFRAGVDKKMIYWYFQSYNNLLRTYIKSKDFWIPVFEKFQSEGAELDQELPDFIRSIFTELFNVFYTEPEMQTFIHWQISDSRPVLREISEEREFQGAKIAAMTDPHFKGTGFNFRAVLALILGGVYYVVWHAKMNQTSVCGIDINVEKDRLDLIRSIGQIIDLVWDAAGKEVA